MSAAIAEVARLTGRSENAVKVMQHRALAALARLLGVSRKQHKAREVTRDTRHETRDTRD